MRLWALLLAAGMGAAGPSVLSGQQAAGPARIEGRVVDASTRAGVPAASVRLLGTTIGVLTAEDGAFTLSGVPPGRHAVRAERIGYAPRVVEVEVGPEGVRALEVFLPSAPVETGALVVSVTKRAQTAGEVPLSVHVVEREELEARTPLTVRDAVEYAPGVQFVGDQVNLRGSSGHSRGTGARVLFLVEGVPANAADAGNIFWDMVPATEVERVEVVTGPGSALYGSSALGGLVSVILREPSEKRHARVRVLGGFYDSPPHREWEWSRKTRGFGSVDVSYGQRLGPVVGWLRYGKARSDGYRENGFFSRTNVSSRFNVLWGARDTLRVFAGFSRDRHGTALTWCVRGQCQDPQALAFQPLRVDSSARGDETTSQKWFGSVQWRRPWSAAIASRARLSLVGVDFVSEFQDSTEGAVSNRLGAEWQLDVRHGRAGVGTVGTEWSRSWVRSDLFGDHDVTDGAAYLQEQWWLARWLNVQAGARADRRWVDGVPEKFQVSPRAGIVLRPDPRTGFRAAAGYGYRTPSVAELFTSTQVQGFRVVPNPDLGADSSRAFELGFDRLVSDRWAVALTAFHVRYTDLIEADTVLGTGGAIEIRFGNRPRARVRGFEGTARWAYGSLLSGSVTYTYLDARDLTEGRDLPYRPRHLATTSLTLRPGGIELGVDHRYASRIRRVQVFPTDERVAMSVIDLRAGYRTGRYGVLLTADNLFNYAFTTIERNLEPLRHFTLSVQAEF